MDELSRMVLGNRKMPSEDSQHITPLLDELKAALRGTVGAGARYGQRDIESSGHRVPNGTELYLPLSFSKRSW